MFKMGAVCSDVDESRRRSSYEMSMSEMVIEVVSKEELDRLNRGESSDSDSYEYSSHTSDYIKVAVREVITEDNSVGSHNYSYHSRDEEIVEE
jgi:hypothetical protein